MRREGSLLCYFVWEYKSGVRDRDDDKGVGVFFLLELSENISGELGRVSFSTTWHYCNVTVSICITSSFSFFPVRECCMYVCVGNTGICPEPFLPFFSKKNTAMTNIAG